MVLLLAPGANRGIRLEWVRDKAAYKTDTKSKEGR